MIVILVLRVRLGTSDWAKDDVCCISVHIDLLTDYFSQV